MKKLILALVALFTFAFAYADQRAFYVKKGDSYTKYSYGVAENLKFLDNGHTLLVEGYDESINLDDIDYITTTPPVTTSLTSAAHKQKLEDIAREALDLVSLYDNSDCLKMIHAFFDCDDTHCHAPCEYDIDQSYYDIYNEFRVIMKSVSKMVKGDCTAVRALTSAVVHTYRFEDYNGIYTANSTTEAWEKTESDQIELRFKGYDNEDFAVSLKASTAADQWESRHFDIRFPEVIDIEFLNGKTTIAKAKLSTSLVQDSRIHMTLDFDANNYVVNNVLEILNTTINDKVTVNINGKYLCSNTAEIKGKNLLVYDEIYDAVKETTHYHNENDDCCGEDPHLLFSHFTRATTSCDVLGKLQIKGKANGFNNFYDALAAEDDNYIRGVELGGGSFIIGDKVIAQKGNEFTVTDENENLTRQHVQTANNYFDIYFHYDGGSNVEGYINLDVTEDSHESNYYYGDDLIITWAHALIDGYLVAVHRDYDYEYDDEGNKTIVYGPWFCYVFNDEERVEKEVDESALVWPSTITYVYYEITPSLVFPDQTSYTFTDFFDENSFGNLIDDCNDIADTYLTITGQERDYDD
jgi:hypothetical protein